MAWRMLDRSWLRTGRQVIKPRELLCLLAILFVAGLGSISQSLSA